MYKSLLPVVKPLVFAGKSGVLHIRYQQIDHARLYFNEGLIEQVETADLQGEQAVEKCLKWVTVETSFEEGKQEGYVRDDTIDTNAILSFLEVAHHNVLAIKQYLTDNNVILQIDPDKLHDAKGMDKETLKAALFFNGKDTLGEVIELTGQPERTILIRACKLLISGCAEILANKEVLDKTERIEFLKTLNTKVIDLVGPVGPVLVDDAMAAIGTEPYSLSREELPRIVEEIVRHVDTDEGTELTVWSSDYFGGRG